MKRILFSILLLAAVYTEAFSRDYIDRVFNASSGQELPYKIAYPENYDPSVSYPLFLFLHGAGERGTDNNDQLVYGRELFLNNAQLKGAIVVAPQCPREDYWVCIEHPVVNSQRQFPANPPISPSLACVKELIDCLIALDIVDTSRIYGSGLSMGGFGILDLTSRYPDLFAAIEPICGGINVDRIAGFDGETAFRFFHGLKDDIVLPVFSQKAHAALLDAGKESFLVEYPEANHNSWTPAFSEPDFISWLFEHIRK